jgi:hypothetical protein
MVIHPREAEVFEQVLSQEGEQPPGIDSIEAGTIMTRLPARMS